MKIKFLLLLVLATASHSAVSDEWSVKTKVNEINTGYFGGLILFKTTESHNNPKGCDVAYYAVREGDADVSQILSVLLAAQKSNGYIRVGVNSSKCDKDGRISVSRIRSLP
ncbi:conserved exported hypothetical protein [Vibrio coralliirubri]|uniref:hypothetical protein n=1 Tax=Vibrio coralliirubri TaxID=1516159 RepID=UPI0006368FD2|nr:hypothetical protein [Vibrio coralliirubri]CDU08705.1 conserved exported hypothetical protein [Vibrio coralliirubri]